MTNDPPGWLRIVTHLVVVVAITGKGGVVFGACDLGQFLRPRPNHRKHGKDEQQCQTFVVHGWILGISDIPHDRQTVPPLANYTLILIVVLVLLLLCPLLLAYSPSLFVHYFVLF